MKKIIVLICAILFSFLLLEISLRLGGLIYSSWQESRNRATIRQKGTFRIMCLGESTTAGGKNSYPDQLEEILNQSDIGIKFSVINKGVPGIETSYILTHLVENLRECRPDMVTAMMGANDYYVKYYEGIPDSDSFFFRNFRAYRLFRIILKQIMNKSSPAVASLAQIKKQNAEPESGFFDTPVLEEGPLRKTIAVDPENENAYFELGRLYMHQLRFAQAQEALEKSITLNSQNEKALMMLGYSYKNQFKYPQAEEAFRKIVELNPQNNKAYIELGLCCMYQGKYSQAEKMFQRSLQLKPEDDKVYAALAIVYQETGSPGLAIEYHKKAEAIRAIVCSPNLYMNYQKLKQALDKRKIKLVCIQYPMRSFEPLRKIFAGDGSAIFVDNEKIFKDAVKKYGFKKYFTDMFGGDFGHCTPEGNRLIAQNLANVILKEYFNK